MLAIFGVEPLTDTLSASVGTERFLRTRARHLRDARAGARRDWHYGVLSYAVAQRTREIGSRIALGASSCGITRLVLDQGVLLALIGLATRIVLAAVVARSLAGVLFAVDATGPGDVRGCAGRSCRRRHDRRCERSAARPPQSARIAPRLRRVSYPDACIEHAGPQAWTSCGCRCRPVRSRASNSRSMTGGNRGATPSGCMKPCGTTPSSRRRLCLRPSQRLRTGHIHGIQKWPIWSHAKA